ncbi:uncharacterized protein LOC119944328 [Tachyglossus aculeatus]|uniref:uncharacterized protein LOC119944328 n=1 Tax=Tachyglossus aculeatus TaxID=9261 RepID=UPI0018F7484A|nr:uncharacterized protein LOC119944328 [Tachyglossus aculeatus]
MYWYRQDLEQGPNLMFYFLYQKLSENMMVPQRFQPNCPRAGSCTLNIGATELGDSSVFLCASTPLHRTPTQPMGKRQDCDITSRHTPVGSEEPKSHISGGNSLELGEGPVRPNPVMGPGPVWLVAVCVLRAGPMDAGVTQTPRHLVTSQGQNVMLSCVPISSHYVLVWYRQRMGKGLELLMSFQNKQPVQEMQSNDSSRFSISWFQEKSCHLHLNPSLTSDSAVYLCASSADTALHSPLTSVHKPPFPAQEAGTDLCQAQGWGDGWESDPSCFPNNNSNNAGTC